MFGRTCRARRKRALQKEFRMADKSTTKRWAHVEGGNNALDDFHYSVGDVAAWDGDCLHFWRFPAHPPGSCNRSGADPDNPGPTASMKLTSAREREPERTPTHPEFINGGRYAQTIH